MIWQSLSPLKHCTLVSSWIPAQPFSVLSWTVVFHFACTMLSFCISVQSFHLCICFACRFDSYASLWLRRTYLLPFPSLCRSFVVVSMVLWLTFCGLQSPQEIPLPERWLDCSGLSLKRARYLLLMYSSLSSFCGGSGAGVGWCFCTILIPPAFTGAHPHTERQNTYAVICQISWKNLSKVSLSKQEI